MAGWNQVAHSASRGDAMTPKEKAVVRAAVKWAELERSHGTAHESDCGCSLCVDLMRAVAALEKKKEPR